ncbi:MAG: DUF3791 domain-containing protein [Eubacteriales bacterium]|nr:DUF3791 domain-containing protein [Eubacteriales bacterium]
MTRKEEILYMQTRLFRLAVNRWNKTEEEVAAIFDQYAVCEYVEEGYDLLHMEGDAAVMAEIEEMIRTKGAVL